MAVRCPQIIERSRAVDFGNAFYLTSSLEQARRWARIKTRRISSGCATISVFEFDFVSADRSLSIMNFPSATKEWLRFVAANRSGKELDGDWDVIIGPVANDNTMPVINLYLKGSYTEEEALRRLLPQRLENQFAFRSLKALEFLKFMEVIADEAD